MGERALTTQEATEFRAFSDAASKLLGVTESTAPEAVLQTIEDYVLAWHKPKPGFFARLFTAKPDPVQAALALGALWGDQIVRRFGWQWTCAVTPHAELYGVVMPDRSLAIYPTYFVKACLDDPGADCTVVLASNMLAAGNLPAMPPGGFQDLMAGVQRMVPRA